MVTLLLRAEHPQRLLVGGKILGRNAKVCWLVFDAGGPASDTRISELVLDTTSTSSRYSSTSTSSSTLNSIYINYYYYHYHILATVFQFFSAYYCVLAIWCWSAR